MKNLENKQTYLAVKDHSVSGETFKLLYNSEWDSLETSPQPKAQILSAYYNSEDYISHTDSKRNLLEQVYHQVRKCALKRKLKLINSFQSKDVKDPKKQKKNLLDLGCGTGDFLEIAKQNGWQITGIEPNPEARKIANTKTGHFVFGNEHFSILEPHTFDVITLWHVLEHLKNPEEQVKQLKYLLKPNGRLVVAVPNYKSYDANHYKTHWAAYDVPRHLWHFSQKGIKQLFAQEHFEVESTMPLMFDAYYVSLLSEKYKTGFMNPFKAFWIGWCSNAKAKSSGDYSSLIYVIKNT